METFLPTSVYAANVIPYHCGAPKCLPGQTLGVPQLDTPTTSLATFASGKFEFSLSAASSVA